MPYDSKRINGPPKVFSPLIYMKRKVVEYQDERKDGRKMLEGRRISLKVGVVNEARGSAYMEIGKTKIICSVYGPREIQRTQSFSNKGQLFCEFKYAPFSCWQHHTHQQSSYQERELSNILKEAIEPVVCLHKFPKCTIDIFVLVLENDGSILSSGITCAGAALADAGIDMYDLVVGCSIRKMRDNLLIDPTLNEEYLPNDSTVGVDNGNVTIGFMPSLKQVSALHLDGELEVETVNKSIKLLMDGCWNIYPVVKQCLLQSLKQQLKQKESEP